jgi:hypothetical protein
MSLSKSFFFFSSRPFLYYLYYIILYYILLYYNKYYNILKKGPGKKIKNFYNESNLPNMERMSNFPSMGVVQTCESKLVYLVIQFACEKVILEEIESLEWWIP